MFNKKKKYIISIEGLPIDEVKKLEAKFNDPKTKQRVWVTSRPVKIVSTDE